MSVVIPTYNASALLLETLGTVFRQTHTDFEAVVVVDGCTDDTLEKLRQVHDARLRIVEQPNGGIGVARNRGIDEARGKYVALLDHDDLWHPRKLEVQVDFLQRHPQCASATSPFDTTESLEVPQFRREEVCAAPGVVPRPLRVMATGTQLILSSALIFVREAATGLRYATQRQCIEDLPFQIKLMGRGDFGIAGDDILMTYRMHASNYSKQASFYYNGVRLLRKMDRNGEFAEFTGEARQDLDLYIAYMSRWATMMQITGGYRGQALSLYLSELPHQLRLRRWRYIAAMPPLLLMPYKAIRKRYGQHATS
ncbi:MAG TPA: glycosyltransferase family 2 protein [Tepidisphaeraceae bacterium]